MKLNERHGYFWLKVKALAWRDVSDSVSVAFVWKGDIHFLDPERELAVGTRHFLALLKHKEGSRRKWGSVQLLSGLKPRTARRELRAVLVKLVLEGRIDLGLELALQIEAIEVHDLVPGGYEVSDELLLGVTAGIGFRDGAEL